VFPSIVSIIIKIYPFEVLFFNCSLVICKELVNNVKFFIIFNLLQEPNTLYILYFRYSLFNFLNSSKKSLKIKLLFSEEFR
jgi:hypothetical protein